MCNLTAPSSHPSLRLLAGFLFLLTFWKQVVALLPSPTLSVRCITRTHSTLITMNKPSTILIQQTEHNIHHSRKFLKFIELLDKEKSKKKLLMSFYLVKPQTRFSDSEINYATQTTSHPFIFYNPHPVHKPNLCAKYRDSNFNTLAIFILPNMQSSLSNIQNLIPTQPLPLWKFCKVAQMFIVQHCYRVRLRPLAILLPIYHNKNNISKSHRFRLQLWQPTQLSFTNLTNLFSYIPSSLYQPAALIFTLISRSDNHYSHRQYMHTTDITLTPYIQKILSYSAAQHKNTTGCLSEVTSNRTANTSNQFFLLGPA